MSSCTHSIFSSLSKFASGLGIPWTCSGSLLMGSWLMNTTWWPWAACVTAAWNNSDVLHLKVQIELQKVHSKTQKGRMTTVLKKTGTIFLSIVQAGIFTQHPAMESRSISAINSTRALVLRSLLRIFCSFKKIKLTNSCFQWSVWFHNLL